MVDARLGPGEAVRQSTTGEANATGRDYCGRGKELPL
jgi:hypothetical protein